MFTGIIEEIGIMKKLIPDSGGYRLTIEAKKVLSGTILGDSIAVNGICLTVVSFDSASWSADVMPETLRKSSLANIGAGSRVNLERALTLSSRLGGHLVSGHIDGTAQILARREEGNSLWLIFEAGPELLKYIALKGSIALDGTSLTVAEVKGKTFSVGLIPATQEMTILAEKRAGDAVNVETDLVAKHIERLLEFRDSPGKPPMNMDFLKENGYA